MVADGAGSAKISRQGSRLACEYIIDHFKNVLSGEMHRKLETLILSNQAESNDAIKKELNLSLIHI